MGRDTSDEAYVIDLCDRVLGIPGLRQHRFDWLLGDPASSADRWVCLLTRTGRMPVWSLSTASCSTSAPHLTSTSQTA